MRSLKSSIRPSPGLVLGMIALVGAVATTSWALPGQNSVNSGDLRNGSVKRADQAPSQRTDWVLLDLNGGSQEIVRQSGGADLTFSSNSGAMVNFHHSLAGRPITASGVAPSGSVAVGLCGGGPEGVECPAPGANNTRHVEVEASTPGSRVYVAVLPK